LAWVNTLTGVTENTIDISPIEASAVAARLVAAQPSRPSADKTGYQRKNNRSAQAL
jgi:hypothetical protein